MLYGCNRLVGGTGYVPTSTAGKNNLVLGSTGVLTGPGSDSGTWVWAHLYASSAQQVPQCGVCSEKAAKPLAQRGASWTIALSL